MILRGIGAQPATAAETAPLRISVYATAGDIQQHLATRVDRERSAEFLKPLRVSRLWLEGRRGDEYVAPERLRQIQAFFADRGIDCAGGIATIPGNDFGTRQNGGLSWLNWESEETRSDVTQFFSETAPVFRTIIVDDFFCTADTSPVSERARGDRSWGQYRRDLMVSLIEPIILRPARAARPDGDFVLKYPQWYDRFHLFGYDPARMSPQFDSIWVGTEVRNPQTRRMGFVQPTEGYINFRWLASVAGNKVRGAWFDHIECEPDHFLDQAYQSVLAGAGELTLFRLGDIVQGHPGDELLARRLPGLFALRQKVRDRTMRGMACYKPAGSDSDENIYLMDYLAMIGLPIVPTATYPKDDRIAFLPVQAASDPLIVVLMEQHLDRGGTLVVTPAFLRAAGPRAAQFAGVKLTAASVPVQAVQAILPTAEVPLETPLDVDGGLHADRAKVLLAAKTSNQALPLIAANPSGNGRVMVFNVRTFSEQDFHDAEEWLLAPKPLGLPVIPQALADALRAMLLEPLDIEFNAPAGVGLYLFDQAACLYNFRNEAAPVVLGGKSLALAPKSWQWLAMEP